MNLTEMTSTVSDSITNMTPENRRTTGLVLFIAAMGSMCLLMSAEIINLKSWDDMTAPLFVGKAMAHLGVVITSFLGGKLIPSK